MSISLCCYNELKPIWFVKLDNYNNKHFKKLYIVSFFFYLEPDWFTKMHVSRKCTCDHQSKVVSYDWILKVFDKYDTWLEV